MYCCTHSWATSRTHHPKALAHDALRALLYKAPCQQALGERVSERQLPVPGLMPILVNDFSPLQTPAQASLFGQCPRADERLFDLVAVGKQILEIKDENTLLEVEKEKTRSWETSAIIPQSF